MDGTKLRVTGVAVVAEVLGVEVGNIVDETGRRVVILFDAADLLAERFQTTTRNDPPEYAIELLLRAAETGTLADREAASNQVALVLKLNAMA